MDHYTTFEEATRPCYPEIHAIRKEQLMAATPLKDIALTKPVECIVDDNAVLFGMPVTVKIVIEPR